MADPIRALHGLAGAALAAAGTARLSRPVTRRVPLASFHEGFTCRRDDVTVIIELEPAE